ncbi:MAG: Mur ligase family protein, partial [Pseudomonadota bacterium]|nr:Mur ligase family protein [Pseudomonadota bacterium]
MPDHAISDDPRVQRQLDRLTFLSPGADTLGLERIGTLLARLGNPERVLPPIFHVAGTNGKGSTCAFLRAAIEAAGLSAHVYTSPHLVRFNERIRVAGALIADDALAALLEEVLNVAAGIEASFFEVTTAAAFLAFARTPADACIVEVGLGGRLDATNVIAAPAVCGIAGLGIDHQFFLGDTLEGIAAEKAGIAKAGVPLVTLAYPDALSARIAETAANAGAIWLPRGGDWNAEIAGANLNYRDLQGEITLPLPALAGAHQAMNAALAVAMLRHQRALTIPETALHAAMDQADWPARLQRLSPGPLHALLPQGAELWLDGGHNPAAARAVADFFARQVPAGRAFHIVLGLLENKDAKGLLAPFRDRAAAFHTVPVEGHPHHHPAALAALAHEEGHEAMPAETVEQALATIARHAGSGPAPTVLI